MKQFINLKSEHKGKIISEDIRTAKQAVAKIVQLGGKWESVTADEVKVCRLHFRDGNRPLRDCPSSGVVFFVEKENELAFIKAFCGETKRVAQTVSVNDVWTDCRVNKVQAFSECDFFRTYNGVWAWREQRIVPGEVVEKLQRHKEHLHELKNALMKNPNSADLLEKIQVIEHRIEELRGEYFS